MSRHIHACIALLCLVVCRLTGLPDTITLTDQGIMIRKISWGRKKDRTPLLFFRSPNMCKLTDITACVLLGYTGNFQHCCQGRSFIMYMLNSKYLAGSCKNAINLPFHKMNEISWLSNDLHTFSVKNLAPPTAKKFILLLNTKIRK